MSEAANVKANLFSKARVCHFTVKLSKTIEISLNIKICNFREGSYSFKQNNFDILSPCVQLQQRHRLL